MCFIRHLHLCAGRYVFVHAQVNPRLHANACNHTVLHVVLGSPGFEHFIQLRVANRKPAFIAVVTIHLVNQRTRIIYIAFCNGRRFNGRCFLDPTLVPREESGRVFLFAEGAHECRLPSVADRVPDFPGCWHAFAFGAKRWPWHHHFTHFKAVSYVQSGSRLACWRNILFGRFS